MLSLITLTGTLPTACVASVWNSTPLLFRDLADLRDRLDHADFVVGVHDADQDGLVGDRVLQLVQIDQAIRSAPADR